MPEGRNPNSLDMDSVSTLELLAILNEEDRLVAPAVGDALPELARAVDLAADRYRRGGTVHYLGAGTSGRIAVQDASELIPTFGIEAGRVVAHIAGGESALLLPVEGAEDDTDAALAGVRLDQNDVVVGLTASGSTPFVAGGLARATQAGALTILITANPAGALLDRVDVGIVLATGPEVLAGSTRLKAGSAQKMALNSFSTALMTKVGRTWSNLMVSMSASNHKLRARAVRVVSTITGADEAAAAQALDRCSLETGVTVVHLLGKVEPAVAKQALEAAHGSVRQAIADLSRP